MRYLLLVLLGITPLPSHAQDADVESARTHVVALFEAMRSSDADAVRSHFHSETATLYSVTAQEDGSARVIVGDIGDFAESVGRADVGSLDEHLGPIDVVVDGPLATATMPYAFFLRDQFSHCGVNVFHLVRTHDGWRTIHITDTRRRTDCHPSVAPDTATSR